MKVRVLRIYGGQRVRGLVDSLSEPEIEGGAFGKIMAKLNASFLPKKNTYVLWCQGFVGCVKMITRRLCSATPAFDQKRRNAYSAKKELEIKRHLQQTVRNPGKLAKESVRDLYTLDKLLEEAPANKEAKANELEITAKETQDAGKLDSDANANRVKV